MTEIACRLVREGGPAVMFHRPRAGRELAHAVVLNILATPERLALALGRAPGEIAGDFERFLHDVQPPTASGLWRQRRLLWRGLSLGTTRARHAAWQDVSEAPDLTRLPVLTCWPED